MHINQARPSMYHTATCSLIITRHTLNINPQGLHDKQLPYHTHDKQIYGHADVQVIWNNSIMIPSHLIILAIVQYHYSHLEA